MLMVRGKNQETFFTKVKIQPSEGDTKSWLAGRQ